ncbi:MAG: hypothetical protein K2N36_01305, partial [Ruminiclostridium sp.]|nr:hypothetical protein [Ruminiclostridium sp.]
EPCSARFLFLAALPPKTASACRKTDQREVFLQAETGCEKQPVYFLLFVYFQELSTNYIKIIFPKEGINYGNNQHGIR